MLDVALGPLAPLLPRGGIGNQAIGERVVGVESGEGPLRLGPVLLVRVSRIPAVEPFPLIGIQRVRLRCGPHTPAAARRCSLGGFRGRSTYGFRFGIGLGTGWVRVNRFRFVRN